MNFWKRLRLESVPPILLFLIIFSLATLYRSFRLGSFDFQNDEFFHLNTAVGYLRTGNFVEWNFLENTPGASYPRAWPFTWLVARTFSLWGVGEWQGRLIPLFFGILTLPFVYFLSHRITKNHWVSLGALYLLAFDQVMIWSSRTLRMYSGFVLFSLLALYCIFRGLEEKRRAPLLAGIFFFILSYLFHEEALLLLTGFFLYNFFMMLLAYREKKYFEWNQYTILFLIFAFAGIAFFLIHTFVTPLMTKNFLILRNQPLFEYFVFPFSGLRWFGLGWLFLILGISSWEKVDKIKIYFLSFLPPIFIFLTFFSSWHANKKYILFLLPICFIFFSDGLFRVLQKSLRSQNLALLLFLAIFVLLGPLPRTHNESKTHRFREAYAYVENRSDQNEPIVIQGPKSYYFSRNDLLFFPMKDNKKFRIKDFKAIIGKYPSGWLLWPKFKEDHIRQELKRFAENNLHYERSISQSTNFKIYRWPSP